MILPYVYKLTHKTTGQYYIGYREANKNPSHIDLPKYKSSSSKVKELGFENFGWEIIAEFYSGDDAYDFENILISEHIQDELCLNRQYVIGGKRRFKTKSKLSEETKEKIRQSVKEAMYRPDVQIKLSKSKNAGQIITEETKKKISDSLTGKPKTKPATQEFRDKMKALASNISEETRRKRSLANKAAWERKKLQK